MDNNTNSTPGVDAFIGKDNPDLAAAQAAARKAKAVEIGVSTGKIVGLLGLGVLLTLGTQKFRNRDGGAAA